MCCDKMLVYVPTTHNLPAEPHPPHAMSEPLLRLTLSIVDIHLSPIIHWPCVQLNQSMRRLEHFLIAALFQKRSDITVCIHPTPAISLLRHTMLSIHNDDNNLLSQKISKTINSTTSTLLHIRTTSSIGWRRVILGCRLQPAGRTFVVRCYSASVLSCCVVVVPPKTRTSRPQHRFAQRGVPTQNVEDDPVLGGQGTRNRRRKRGGGRAVVGGGRGAIIVAAADFILLLPVHFSFLHRIRRRRRRRRRR